MLFPSLALQFECKTTEHKPVQETVTAHGEYDTTAKYDK